MRLEIKGKKNRRKKTIFFLICWATIFQFSNLLSDLWIFFARLNPSRGLLFYQKEQNFRVRLKLKNEGQIWGTLIYIFFSLLLSLLLLLLLLLLLSLICINIVHNVRMLSSIIVVTCWAQDTIKPNKPNNFSDFKFKKKRNLILLKKAYEVVRPCTLFSHYFLSFTEPFL